MLKDLIKKTRSYRRFYEDERISIDTLKELVDFGRLSASARNAQPLRYILVADEERKSKIFPLLKWAGYLRDWDGPKVGERPSAYIIVLWDKTITNSKELITCDLGIASQSILLGASEKGLGGCMIWAFNRNKAIELLNIDERYEPLLVIALGKPKETVVLEEVEEGGSIEYWRDETEIHHVPKRRLEDILL